MLVVKLIVCALAVKSYIASRGRDQHLSFVCSSWPAHGIHHETMHACVLVAVTYSTPIRVHFDRAKRRHSSWKCVSAAIRSHHRIYIGGQIPSLSQQIYARRNSRTKHT